MQDPRPNGILRRATEMRGLCIASIYRLMKYIFVSQRSHYSVLEVLGSEDADVPVEVVATPGMSSFSFVKDLFRGFILKGPIEPD